MSSEFQEIALALVQRGGEWLVSRRAPGRPYAGLWEFPGGKIQHAESPEAAAVREAGEETGLRVEAISNLGFIESAAGDQHLRLHLVLCRAEGGEARPADASVTCVEWVSRERLRELPMPPVNEKIIDRLLSGRET